MIIKKAIFIFFVISIISLTASQAKANPIAGTSWLENFMGGSQCFVTSYTKNLASFYVSIGCNNSYTPLGSQPYTISPANNNMYNVKLFKKNGSLGKSYFIGFVQNRSKILECPSDNWESCKYDQTVLSKVDFPN